MKRILLDSVPSTNDYALELLETEQPDEGTIIQARSQTRGRGQMGARWETEPGRNLTVSVILYPTFLDVRRQFLLSQAMALAVSDCVRRLGGGEPEVKWPNDVLLCDRKVAGLLIESRLSGARIRATVVGVGLNVNQESFPPELERAGSLLSVTGVEHDLEEALAVLHAAVLERYAELREGSPVITRQYTGRLHGMGRELLFAAAEASFRGTIRGVDDEGRLLVSLPRGGMRAFRPKEVTYGAPPRVEPPRAGD